MHTRQNSFKIHKENSDQKILCRECNRPTLHEVLFHIEEFRDQNDQGWRYGEWVRNKTVQCKGCQTISFCIEERVHTDVDENGDPYWSEKLYPRRLGHQAIMKDIHLFPKEISSIYKETYSALCNEETILAGIGIRTIIEAVCISQKSAGYTLSDKINSLLKDGFINDNEASVLHKIRSFGNKAAHEIISHKSYDLLAALQVIEIMLQRSYILPQKALELRSC